MNLTLIGNTQQGGIGIVDMESKAKAIKYWYRINFTL
jgi:hypothetical protein